MSQLPSVPLTLEGSGVLHQMLRVKWMEWRDLEPSVRAEISAEASQAMASMEGQGSGAFSLLGHKGDLMLIHFRPTFDDLGTVQSAMRRLRLWDYLEQTTSYVSVVELGLYESTSKTYSALTDKGIVPHSPEWDEGIAETIARQKQAMGPRLYPEIPPAKFACFYPMDRKRGEDKNWYTVPMAERQRMMAEHGAVGRRYAGTVKQIISGSIGFDDWEWGVDLFAEDPLVFKKLIYEMRFDQVSAVYALFGTFYVGQKLPAADLNAFLAL